MNSNEICQSQKFDYLLKLLMLGDSGVGKTSIATRFTNDSFSNIYITTIGVDFSVKLVTLEQDIIKVQVWDTAGQERYKSITSSTSFDQIRIWLNKIEDECGNIQKVLVGNKCDDAENRVVARREAQRFADLIQVQYFETSAKENLNIEEMFNSLIRSVRTCRRSGNQNVVSTSRNVVLKRDTHKKTKKRCC